MMNNRIRDNVSDLSDTMRNVNIADTTASAGSGAEADITTNSMVGRRSKDNVKPGMKKYIMVSDDTSNDNEEDRMKEFARIHYEARIAAGKSREYMADKLGVAKKTIFNWERGISSPSFFQSLEWFRVLKIDPIPEYISFIYPSQMDVKPTDSDWKVEEAFHLLIKEIGIKEKRALLYLYKGKHGSSPYSVIQLLLAHLHLPMSLRINDACNVNTNYKMARELGQLVCPENIQPDLSNFRNSIDKALEACKAKEDRYIGE